MKTWRKVGLVAGVVAVVAIAAWVAYYRAHKDVVTVQTGAVVREDLTTVVTGSGEIRPKNYTNVLGQGSGMITDVAVREGDYVNKGDVLLRIENVQPGADVEAQKATIDATRAGLAASAANYDSAQATLAQRQADLEKARLDWDREQQLFKAQLIAKSEYDASKASYDSAVAALEATKAQVEQTDAARDQAKSTVEQAEAQLRHQQDILRKTTYTAPISGIVSYIAVRVGENVVPGIQNAQGSFLLTISDMSVVTAEVKVDETDITNVHNDLPAEVTIDAIPNTLFTGKVSAVGDLAILRSSGNASMTETTANTQEARDFKVVVTLDNPPPGLRPGLSVTAKVQTAQRKGVLSIPIQALAMRSQKDLAGAKDRDSGSVALAAPESNSSSGAKADVQGVFVVHDNKVQFVPVQTGISGVTDIEVTGGLQQGDQIVIGSYKALRSLTPTSTIKVDNTAANSDSASSS
jgi:HlyD family secretion protein